VIWPACTDEKEAVKKNVLLTPPARLLSEAGVTGV